MTDDHCDIVLIRYEFKNVLLVCVSQLAVCGPGNLVADKRRVACPIIAGMMLIDSDLEVKFCLAATYLLVSLHDTVPFKLSELHGNGS